MRSLGVTVLKACARSRAPAARADYRKRLRRSTCSRLNQSQAEAAPANNTASPRGTRRPEGPEYPSCSPIAFLSFTLLSRTCRRAECLHSHKRGFFFTTTSQNVAQVVAPRRRVSSSTVADGGKWLGAREIEFTSRLQLDHSRPRLAPKVEGRSGRRRSRESQACKMSRGASRRLRARVPGRMRRPGTNPSKLSRACDLRCGAGPLPLGAPWLSSASTWT